MSLPAFQKIQYDFAAHIRDPHNHPPPEHIEDRRIAVYRGLFYNNVEGFMSSGFPVLRSLYSEEDWHGLIRAYFSQHRAHTPHFTEMAEEFVAWLQAGFVPRACDPPFILELAHYEWMETLATLCQHQIEDVSFTPDGNLLEEVVVISPLSWLLSYEWPVHAISTDYRPDEKSEQPTWIVIYRDRHDEVGFIQVNPVTARLMQLLNADENLSGGDALRQIADEMGHPQPAVIVEGGMDTLRQMKRKDIVLGTRKTC